MQASERRQGQGLALMNKNKQPMIGRERKKREAEKREAVGVSAGVQNFKSADWDNGAGEHFPLDLVKED